MLAATWNVNGLRARRDFFLHWLRERRPDVVALQELKLTEDQFPFEELATEGYHATVLGQKAWNGVAVVSREMGEVVRLGLPGEDEMGARLVAARVGGIVVISVYCPNGKSLEHPDFKRKLRWFDFLQKFLESTFTPGDDLLLCGDFNICPTPLDSWNEEELAGRIFHTDVERTRIESLLKWGLVDLFRTLHPDEKVFSWWDYRGGAFHRNQGLRIDLILGTQNLAHRAVSSGTDREYRKKKGDLTPSDHAPVLVEL
jgi:exodeoxyribonuclease-3